CTLTEKIHETKDTMGFSLKLESPFTFVPGQYVMLSFPDSELKRAFSIVEHDKEKNELFLLIKLNGEFTKRIFAADIGTELNLFGPYGRFTLPKEKCPLIFIGGGIGITPLYNMMKNADGFKKRLYYSSRTRDDVLLFDELRKFDTEFFLTREELPGFRHGRVDAKLIKEENKDFLDSIFYICGPEVMIEDMRRQLLNEGIDEERIRSESFN
ncbi:MAG: FAD-dependent oxidoreductase, partial [Candidatus Woesearchaeota archaeon]|nr:FAD-dependent oxidoreductase [Candidatus Woesearchaeota archaeon]